MKRRVFFGAATAALVCMALVLTGCDNGNGNGGAAGFLGTTMELSGQVYEQTWDANDNPVFTRYDGTREITSIRLRAGDGTDIPFPVSGAITGGQLGLTVGTPPPAAMVNIGDIFVGGDILNEELFDNFNISDRTVRALALWSLWIEPGLGIWRERFAANVHEGVIFVYVESDVTVSGNGRATPWEDGYYTITRNFNLNFRAGWNAVRFTIEDLDIGGRETITLGNPANFRWIMD